MKEGVDGDVAVGERREGGRRGRSDGGGMQGADVRRDQMGRRRRRSVFVTSGYLSDRCALGSASRGTGGGTY